MQPDALDLLEIEERIRKLEIERERLASEKFIVPGRQKDALRTLDLELQALEWKRTQYQEHVRSSAAQTQVYEARQKAARDQVLREQEVAERVLDERRSKLKSLEEEKIKEIRAAEMGLASSPGQPREQSPEERRAAFEAFVKKRRLSDVERQVEQAKLLEQEHEPEP